MMGETIEFRSNGSSCRGFLATPAEPAPAVVLIQEWWGVVDQITGVAERLADEGFAVLVPDLYHGAKASEPTDAEKLMMSLNMERAAQDLRGAVAYLQESEHVRGEGVGCVGFCMGGGLAIHLASIESAVAATVVYYGAIPWDHVQLDLSGIDGDVLLHYASEDDWATPEFGRDLQERLADRGVDAVLHIYEGAQHAFLDETRPESHDPEASQVSWGRTVAFLRSSLESTPR
ncbi:MAG: carboxymethylenebutenolidase [Thermoleophilaceae bacterium]|jgi:carboxymethylenebutenolidase|nr:carboxymethylenebutenolidase [Thermoleophilaceae bacterium]MEA2402597.1 carboxymethylenebutenolidase [Thermoleophilaceae bacterium]